MTRVLLPIACLLLWATAERADAQVHFEPELVKFKFNTCSIDTTVETFLINSADTAITAPFNLNPNVSIVEAPDGWTRGANATIDAHDTVRLVLRLVAIRQTNRVSEVLFGDPFLARFTAVAEWWYTSLSFTRAGTSFLKMQIGETRHDTIVIFNPSNESRSIRVRKIISEGDWKTSGFEDGFVLGPGLSTSLIISYTAAKMPFEGQEAELSAQIRDTCVGLDFYFKATLETPLSVTSELHSVTRIIQHGQTLEIEGAQAGANVILSDLTGRKHYSGVASGVVHHIDVAQLPTGAYLLRLSSGKQIQTRKIFIR
jgi:hypothetical protein